ncbi:MAG TPA: VOC family protein [Solirubrobacter sp.]|nr:VOC family protein [Solirubrobacter sp.]
MIYATTDLDAGSARVEAELGLAVLPGGRHVGQGTHNRIVPLGGGYLELLAICDAEEAAASPIGRVLLERIAGDGLLAWAVSGVDVPEVAERLGTPLHSVRRDGMTAHVTGVETALTEPTLPFFVQSDAPSHPGDGGTAGGLTWIEVAGDAARLREWLAGALLPVRVVDGAPAVRAVGIGERELRVNA